MGGRQQTVITASVYARDRRTRKPAYAVGFKPLAACSGIEVVTDLAVETYHLLLILRVNAEYSENSGALLEVPVKLFGRGDHPVE